ncbi:hypothetical protein V1609_15030 [Enterobacter kobei]|uniref:hypothetical protein n=1 Tax=Enterobacter kobei TaxID=208224 RepID=UPI003754D105
MKFTKIEIWLIALTILVFIFCLSAQFPNMHKDVKITDWVSVLINVSLALFAYKGFLLANSWKDDLTRGDGYKLALEIKDDKLHNLRSLIYGFSNFEVAHAFVVGALQNKNAMNPFENKTNEQLAKENTLAIYKNIEMMKKCTRELEISFRNLNSVGWEVSETKKVKLDAVIGVINNIFPIAYPILYASQEALGLSEKYYHRDGSLIDDGYNHMSQVDLLATLDEHCDKFKEHVKNFGKMCSELLDEDLYVLNFFHPKKQ